MSEEETHKMSEEEVEYENEDSASATTTTKRKGRGHKTTQDVTRYAGKSGMFDDVTVNTDLSAIKKNVQKSVEGYVLLVTNVYEEVQEDDIFDKFSECGEVSNLHLNIDNRTGFVKGYAFVEYKTLAEAQAAVQNINGEVILKEPGVCVSFAFKRPPTS